MREEYMGPSKQNINSRREKINENYFSLKKQYKKKNLRAE
jgi:hypothetical protein